MRFTYASSVFEGERAYGGVIFKLSEHSARLRKSAELLGFELPWTVEEIDEACNEVVKANGLTDAYVRPVAWLGSEKMGVSPKGTKPHMAIAAWDWGNIMRRTSLPRASVSISRRGAVRPHTRRLCIARPLAST
jgi:branched-subunit amino acid aminotransferase/4-amino-4-deoxychorismate lyase